MPLAPVAKIIDARPGGLPTGVQTGYHRQAMEGMCRMGRRPRIPVPAVLRAGGCGQGADQMTGFNPTRPGHSFRDASVPSWQLCSARIGGRYQWVVPPRSG
jgi:hypothetical protein